MKEYICIRDFYTEDVKFASKGDIVVLMPDSTTIVNKTGKQKVTHMQGILGNTNYFKECPKTVITKEIVLNNVDHPKHYTQHPSGVECIDITRHYCFSIGNAIKYLWRAGLKKDASLSDKQKEIEDLNKAIWYIKDRINQLQGEYDKETNRILP